MHTKLWLGILNGRDQLGNEDNIDFREIGYEVVDWIQLTQDMVIGSLM